MPRLTSQQEADFIHQERCWEKADRTARALTVVHFRGTTFPDAIAAGTAETAETFFEATRARLFAEAGCPPHAHRSV